MSSLDDKLRALHRGECGCDKYNPELHCRLCAALHAAAAIGAELVMKCPNGASCSAYYDGFRDGRVDDGYDEGYKEGRAEAYEDALSIVRQWSGPGELHHVRIIDIIRARAAEKAGK